MHIVDEPRKFSPSNVLTYTVQGPFYGGRFRAFLDYFSVISQLLLNYFSEISRMFPISCLFLTYFLLISQLFLASQPFLVYFSIIYQIFPISQSKI